MQIMLQITCETPAEMIKVLASFETAQTPTTTAQLESSNEVPTQTNGAQPAGAVPGPRRGRPPKAVVIEPPKETPAPPLEAKPNLKVVEKDEEVEDEAPEITMPMVRDALTKYLAVNTEPMASALLMKHGHTDRLSKLKREHFAAVYAAATTPTVKDAPKMFDDKIPF